MRTPVKPDQTLLLTALAMVIGTYLAIDRPNPVERIPFVAETDRPAPPLTQVAFTKLGR